MFGNHIYCRIEQRITILLTVLFTIRCHASTSDLRHYKLDCFSSPNIPLFIFVSLRYMWLALSVFIFQISCICQRHTKSFAFRLNYYCKVATLVFHSLLIDITYLFLHQITLMYGFVCVTSCVRTYANKLLALYVIYIGHD